MIPHKTGQAEQNNLTSTGLHDLLISIQNLFHAFKPLKFFNCKPGLF